MAVRKMLLYLVICLAVPKAFGQNYEIRLARTDRAGEKIQIDIAGSKSLQMITSRQGQVLENRVSSLSAKLVGILTILEVDHLNRGSKFSVIVSRCSFSLNGNGEDQELVAKGSEIVARLLDGKEEYLVNGQIASNEIAEVLSTLFVLPQSETTDDDVFGTKERKKVGDSWGVNVVKAASSLSPEFKLAPEDMKGTTTLEKILEIDGVKCLWISGKLDINKASPPLPPGFVVEKSHISAAFAGVFPIDVSLDYFSEEMSMRAAIEAKGDSNDPNIRISLNVEESRIEKHKPLK